MNLRNVRIGARLGLGFGVVLMLLAAAVVGGNIARERAMRQLDAGLAQATAKTALATTMKGALLEGAMATLSIGLQADVAGTQAEEARVKEQRRRYGQAQASLIALGLDEAEKDILTSIERLDAQTEKPLLEAVGQSLLFNAEVAAKVIKTQIEPLQRRQAQEIGNLVERQQAALSALLEQAAAQGRQLDTLLYLLGAVALAVGIVLSVVITRSITRPLQGAVALARGVADGDLSVRVTARGGDETAQLLQALDDMTGKLRALVGEVAAGARSVANGSAQIAQGNVDLSQRTEEQASTLEETASSMEELTSSVTQNAHNARQASELAARASEVARRGGAAVENVVNTMTGISESSRRITDITGVIDGIAFQTNILALNAAVEAARAGEQGRGFAVVAAEVRSLAQRSAAAAKEIKVLISDSAGRVEAGTRQVDSAGKTMAEIVDAVGEANALVAEIAAASQEQSAGIEQVNTAISQMEQVVQQNAALVEEATASTESMKEQARALNDNVSRFRLESRGAAPPAPRESSVDATTAAHPIRLRDMPPKGSSPRAPESLSLPLARVGTAGQWKEF